MDLVGSIYDTVLDRTIWPDVLSRLSLFIPGAASAVFWEDGASNQGDVISTTAASLSIIKICISANIWGSTR